MTVTTLVYTGASQDWVVPSGVTFVTIECWGAASRASDLPTRGSTTAQQFGGYAKARLIVTPGTVLHCNVAGGEYGYGGGSAILWSSGGNPALVAGGASDVRIGGTSFADRVVVAGGAGLAFGSSFWPGVGGGTEGGGSNTGGFPGDGAGGTQTTGYALGVGEPGAPAFFSGSSTQVMVWPAGGGYWGGFGAHYHTGPPTYQGVGGGGSGHLAVGFPGYVDGTMLSGAVTYDPDPTYAYLNPPGVHPPQAYVDGRPGGSQWEEPAGWGYGQIVITAVNTPPLAPTHLGPSTNGYVVASIANTLTIQANDADPGDYVTRVDFKYKKTTDPTFTVVNNVTTTQVGSDPLSRAYVLPAGTFTVGNQYEVQWVTYDNASAASPASASVFLNAIAAIPAPTITAPVSGGLAQVTTPVPFQWTLPTGYSQDAYEVLRVQLPPGTSSYSYVDSHGVTQIGSQVVVYTDSSGNTLPVGTVTYTDVLGGVTTGSALIYYDTGVVASTGLATTVPLDASTGRTDYLVVRFRYFGHWSPFASISILNEFGPPQTPIVGLVLLSKDAAVQVNITNPAASGGFADTVSNDVIRTGPDGTVTRIATRLTGESDTFGGAPLGDTSFGPSTGVQVTFVDETPGAGLNDYVVVAYAANGATATSE